MDSGGGGGGKQNTQTAEELTEILNWPFFIL